MRLLILLMLIGATGAQAAEKVFRVGGKPHLILENLTGNIVVERGDPGTIVVATNSTSATDINAQQQGDRIRIQARTTWSSGSIDDGYRITMPDGRLEIRTTSGSIRVDGVNGEHELRTVNGDIEVSRLEGRLELHSVNGSILISRTGKCEVDAVSFSGSVRYRHGSLVGGAYSFSTTNGDIVIDHDARASYQISGRTINGAITDRTGKLEITSSKYANTQTVTGAHGEGRVLVRASSVNGNLLIKHP